jgi:hypothetical protein
MRLIQGIKDERQSLIPSRGAVTMTATVRFALALLALVSAGTEFAAGNVTISQADV